MVTTTMPCTPLRSTPPLARRTAVPLTLLVLLALGGCASTGSGSSTSGSRNEISREQLAERPEATVFDVVRRIHPRWLRSRAAGTSVSLDDSDIAVYINDQREPGGLRILRSLRAADLERIEYFDSRRATTRWGTGHPAGAIVLVLM